jgi:hypothetical protein
VDPKLARALK